MSEGQVYFPDFGYTGPIRTKERCKNPAFHGKTNRNYHRVGLIIESYDKISGFSVVRKCVNCGRKFGSVFKPCGRGEAMLIIDGSKNLEKEKIRTQILGAE